MSKTLSNACFKELNGILRECKRVRNIGKAVICSKVWSVYTKYQNLKSNMHVIKHHTCSFLLLFGLTVSYSNRHRVCVMVGSTRFPAAVCSCALIDYFYQFLTLITQKLLHLAKNRFRNCILKFRELTEFVETVHVFCYTLYV